MHFIWTWNKSQRQTNGKKQKHSKVHCSKIKVLSSTSLNCHFLNNVKRKFSIMDKINWCFFSLYGINMKLKNKTGLKPEWNGTRKLTFRNHCITLFKCKFFMCQNANVYNTIPRCEFTILGSCLYIYKRRKQVTSNQILKWSL